MTTTLLWLLAIAVALVGIHHLALWAESRGWIFYRHRKASPGTAGRAFMEVQSLLEPRVEHLVTSERRETEEQDDSGEPPTPGRGDREVG